MGLNWCRYLRATSQQLFLSEQCHAIYEYEIATGASFALANIKDLDKRAASEDFINGYDSLGQ